MRLALLLLLSSCAADFTGTWTGSLSQKVTCYDGSGGVRDLAARWVVAETRTEIVVSPGGTCGDFTAKVSGNWTAGINRKECGERSTSTYRYVEDITGGELEMGESRNLFGVTLNEGAIVYGGAIYKGTCTSTTTGRLLKE